MPTIEAISTAPYDVPLKGALTWGSGHRLAHLRHVLVRVELSDGAVGIAEATPRPSIYGETQASVSHIVEAHLTPLLVGCELTDFDSVAAATERLKHIKNNNCAKGALDMAAHQALARSRGEGLAQYLGAARRRLEVSAIVSTGAQESVLADVAAWHGQGLRVFKVKIGADIEGEIETIKRLIGLYPQARFYVDANETLDRDGAAAVLNRLRGLGVLFCEEALPVYQLKARRALRQGCDMPIIADDSAFTLEDLRREIESDTFDVLNIKTARTGFSVSRRMLELCAAGGKRVMVGSQASSLLGCLQAACFAGDVAVDCPSECSFYLKTAADLSSAPVIMDGWLSLEEVGRSLEAIQDELVDFV